MENKKVKVSKKDLKELIRKIYLENYNSKRFIPNESLKTEISNVLSNIVGREKNIILDEDKIGIDISELRNTLNEKGFEPSSTFLTVSIRPMETPGVFQ